MVTALVLISLVVAATSLWAYFDAHMLASRTQALLGERKHVAQHRPVFWLFACLVLWVVFFPLYVVARSSFQAALKDLEHTRNRTSHTS